MGAKAASKQKGAKRRRAHSPAPRRREGITGRPSARLPVTLSSWDAFYRVMRRIPAGRVCTYGAVAAMAGRPRAARHVGFALAALKETGPQKDVPWHRVLGSRPGDRAGVSIRDPMGGEVQRAMLEAEGVKFDAKGNVALDRFGWFGVTRTAAPTPRQRAAKARPRKA